jgi:hypothetical protein
MVVVYSEQESVCVASIDAIPDEGCKGVEVTVMTMVEGLSYSVTTIVDSNVDSFVSVTAGRVDAGSVTVVTAAAAVGPPSTGTTEYVACLHANRSPRGLGRKGRASASVMIAGSRRRLGNEIRMVLRVPGATKLLRRCISELPRVPRGRQ